MGKQLHANFFFFASLSFTLSNTDPRLTKSALVIFHQPPSPPHRRLHSSLLSCRNDRKKSKEGDMIAFRSFLEDPIQRCRRRDDRTNDARDEVTGVEGRGSEGITFSSLVTLAHVFSSFLRTHTD